jgi:hypothetical protein
LMSKKKRVRRIFGEWFREKITRNPKFLLVGISLGSSTWSKESGYERRRYKLMKVIIPLSNMGLNLFVEGRQKLVRGRISCTNEKD